VTAPLPPTLAGLTAAVESLHDDGLVCFPTDTVYGLGCVAESAAARDRFYAAKARDAGRPSILMVASPAALGPWVEVDDVAERMMRDHWPGALTLVLRATPRAVARLGPVVAGRTLAVRVPEHDTALALLAMTGAPLATSSANVAGGAPPRSGAEALAAMGERVDVVIDGDCPLGMASSILDLTGAAPRVIREGAIPAARLLS
jgi:L-threonylcarbamoyladenylate synthase